MFNLYCSSDNDKILGEKYIKQLTTAYEIVSNSFNSKSQKIELNILSREEWNMQPFGKSQPYGSPICPDYQIYIGSSIDPSLLISFLKIQKKLNLMEKTLSEEDFGLLLIHELGHILLKYDLPPDFFQSELFKQIEHSKYSFLGEFHADLVLMHYLHESNKESVWKTLSDLCLKNKNIFKYDYGTIIEFGLNYQELLSKDSGSGIIYFQLLFSGIADRLYSTNYFSNNPLKLFNEELTKVKSFSQIEQSKIFNKIIELGS